MSKHVHAELMMQYAQDALETDKPWERWEYDRGNDGRTLTSSPLWSTSTKYRRKPEPYVPTLLDEALELEIEAVELRMTHVKTNLGSPVLYESYSAQLQAMIARRKPEMVGYLEAQGLA